jgi:hypothetical protein
MQTVPMVFLESPTGDEIKEVEATSENLTPLMVAGWHQVPPPAKHETVILADAKEGK